MIREVSMEEQIGMLLAAYSKVTKARYTMEQKERELEEARKLHEELSDAFDKERASLTERAKRLEDPDPIEMIVTSNDAFPGRKIEKRRVVFPDRECPPRERKTWDRIAKPQTIHMVDRSDDSVDPSTTVPRG